MREFIAQKEEVCQTCGGELPKGSVIYVDSENSNETVICQDCIDEFDFDSHEECLSIQEEEEKEEEFMNSGGADRW